MPRLALAVIFIALAALAGSLSYAGFLVVGALSGSLGIGRLTTGLLLGIVFARLPSIKDGRLRTIGLLPKPARRPVMLALLAFSLLSYLYRGEAVPVVFLGFAAAFLLLYPRVRQLLVGKAMSSFFKPFGAPDKPKKNDDSVIDVEFREKKD